MADELPEQTYASHRRLHPLYHFFIAPITFANVIFAVVAAFRYPSRAAVWQVIMALAIFAIAVVVRTYSLRVQDRLIRLEERLRLQRLLPAEMHGRIDDLRTSHLIAMRFCHDDEVCELAKAILDGEVKTADEIKKRIRTWRPDWLRV